MIDLGKSESDYSNENYSDNITYTSFIDNSDIIEEIHRISDHSNDKFSDSVSITNDSESESSSSISTDSELDDYEEDQNILNDNTEINTAKKTSIFDKTSFVIHDPEPNISRVISRDIAVNQHNIKLPENIFMFIDVKEGMPIESTPTKPLQYDKTTIFFRVMKDIAALITPADNGIANAILANEKLGNEVDRDPNIDVLATCFHQQYLRYITDTSSSINIKQICNEIYEQTGIKIEDGRVSFNCHSDINEDDNQTRAGNENDEYFFNPKNYIWQARAKQLKVESMIKKSKTPLI